jgi:dipeptidase E
MQIVAMGGGGFGMEPENPLHYDGEAQRRPTYQRLVASGLPAGYAADDGCALHFEQGQLKRIVSSRIAARAYRVELAEGVAKEIRLEADYLG